MFLYELEPRFMKEHVDYLFAMLSRYDREFTYNIKNVAKYIDRMGSKAPLYDMVMKSSLEDIVCQLEYAMKFCREYLDACKDADEVANNKAKAMHFGPRYVWNSDLECLEKISVEEAAERKNMGVMEYLAWETENLFADEPESLDIDPRENA